MPDRKSRSLVSVLKNLSHRQPAQPDESIQAGLDSSPGLLRRWQAARLRTTYADFLSQPRYQQACQFFLSDIYGEDDTAERDQASEQLYESLASLLPAESLAVLSAALELNRLTRSLDRSLWEALVTRLGVTDSISIEQYARAYQVCDNRAGRLRQIDMLVQLLREVSLSARHPLVGAGIRLSRLPARKSGWGLLHDFVERGYQAFLPMRGVEDVFIQAVQSRETLILDRLLSAHPDPFDWSTP